MKKTLPSGAGRAPRRALGFALMVFACAAAPACDDGEDGLPHFDALPLPDGAFRPATDGGATGDGPRGDAGAASDGAVGSDGGAVLVDAPPAIDVAPSSAADGPSAADAQPAGDAGVRD